MTCLMSYGHAESDDMGTVDCVCVAFNDSPGHFTVHTRRERREGTSILQPYFEPVASCVGPQTRGPLSMLRIGTRIQSALVEQFKFYAQWQKDPPRLFEGQISDRGILDVEEIAPNLALAIGVGTPSRGSA